jgi:predicted CoA-substrate-specific enzyme activase
MGGVFAGLDSGTVSTVVVIINHNKEILSNKVVYSGANSRQAAEIAYQAALAAAGINRSQITYMISTGHGRSRITFTDAYATGVACHAKGAHFLFPETRTVIDIGGHDCKVINIDERGLVTGFAVNDRCAAGTGRYMEMMAGALDVELDEMGDLSLKAKKDLTLNSTCSVFAESEVKSLLLKNHDLNDIAASVHRAVAQRAISLLGRQNVIEKLMLTGGVAKNKGVVAAFESLLKTKIIVPENPQIVCALGAALIALENYDENTLF